MLYGTFLHFFGNYLCPIFSIISNSSFKRFCKKCIFVCFFASVSIGWAHFGQKFQWCKILVEFLANLVDFWPSFRGFGPFLGAKGLNCSFFRQILTIYIWDKSCKPTRLTRQCYSFFWYVIRQNSNLFQKFITFRALSLEKMSFLLIFRNGVPCLVNICMPHSAAEQG